MGALDFCLRLNCPRLSGHAPLPPRFRLLGDGQSMGVVQASRHKHNENLRAVELSWHI